MVSVRPLTLMSPDDGRVTDTGGLSCDLLLRNRAVLCGGGSGGVGNFKCTKAHHRGQRQDTLIQPTRFCPPGVCLFKISSKECYSIQSALKKICVWHKLSCDLRAHGSFAAKLCRSISSPSLSYQFGKGLLAESLCRLFKWFLACLHLSNRLSLLNAKNWTLFINSW